MKTLLLIFFTCITLSSAFPQGKVLQIGEELRYKVYFGFIKLGEVKFKLTSTFKEGGSDIYRAKAEIKSYEGMPLVTAHFIFESEMASENDKKEVYSSSFYSTEFKEKSITRTDYDFIYDSNYVRVTKETDNHLENYGKFPISPNTNYQDGLSLFYNSRLQSFANKNYNIPVFINEKESSVRYSYNMNADVVNTDVVDYGISVIKIAGVAGFEGVFGLTGEFAGWFSNDDQRIPIKAQLNVKIGSITLELYSYKRTGWTPPKFEN